MHIQIISVEFQKQRKGQNKSNIRYVKGNTKLGYLYKILQLTSRRFA